MKNTAQTTANYLTAAASGMDIFTDTNTHTPIGQIRGWKYIAVMDDATIETAVEGFSDTPSTGINGVAFPAGSLIAANGLFTSVKMADQANGVIACIRG